MDDVGGLITAVIGALHGAGIPWGVSAGISAVLVVGLLYVKVSKQRADNTVTLAGVQEAGVKGLIEQMDDLREQNQEQTARIEELSKKIDTLREDLLSERAERRRLEVELQLAEQAMTEWQRIWDILMAHFRARGYELPTIVPPSWPLRNRSLPEQTATPPAA